VSESYEILQAERDITYPAGCDAVSLTGFLRPLTYVDHGLNAFPWHVVGRLVKQLEDPEPNFEYLHITKYCVARATLLALMGDVLDQSKLHTALSKHQVQFGGIYRNHLIRVFRSFLEKNNIAKLPECDIHMIDPLHGEGQVAKNRNLLQCLIHTAEFDYTNTLIFLSLAPDDDEKIYEQTAGYWGRGGEMPKGSSIPVVVTLHATGYYINPCKEDAKRMSSAGRRMQKITVRLQEVFEFEKNENLKTEPVGSKKVESTTGTTKNKTADTAARPLVKVIGDFRAIILPNERKAISLTRKYKMRPFLRFVHSWVTERGTPDFYIEELRDAYNAQFTGSLVKKGWRSDRFQDDLFRDNKREFALLFDTIDKTTGHYRLKVTFQTAETPRRRG
jgi:hypothetical protein